MYRLPLRNLFEDLCLRKQNKKSLPKYQRMTNTKILPFDISSNREARTFAPFALSLLSGLGEC